MIDQRECGIVWRTKAMIKNIGPGTALAERREALQEAEAWLGTLPPRLALEQEDALSIAATRCGYSVEAARRVFQEKFFRDVIPARGQSLARKDLDHQMERGFEL
jgi:hypothetical protein